MRVFKFWIPLAIAITFLCGLVYVVVQQNYRQSANDPQIQMAQDSVSDLVSGQEPQSVIPKKQIDMAKSLAPYIIVFSSDREPIASSVKLANRIPKPPVGVFDFVETYGQEWFTWEPQRGVRSAVVLKKYPDGFVLAGRSLREVEKRENKLTLFVFLAWVGSLGTTFVAIGVLVLLENRFSTYLKRTS